LRWRQTAIMACGPWRGDCGRRARGPG